MNEQTLCLKHFYQVPCLCCPETLPVRWRIDIPDIPKEENYNGPPQATLLRRMKGETMWEALGYLLLSANPKCPIALKELVEAANVCQEATKV